MRAITFTTAFTFSVLAASLSHAELFKIGGFVFDDTNAVKTAAIVDGPVTLPDHSNRQFARYSEEYVASPTAQINEFEKFDRSRSIGCLLGRPQRDGLARHVSFAEPGGMVPMPNTHRTTIEVTWGDNGVPNRQGADFIVFESGSWEPFTASVRKVGSVEFSNRRYKFPDATDKVHNVNAVAFDLSDFGLAEGEIAAAIRIGNVFNSNARVGADKVDNETGEGNVLVPGEPEYSKASTLLTKPGGAEPKNDALGADIVYVVSIHPVLPLKPVTGSNAEPTSEQRK